MDSIIKEYYDKSYISCLLCELSFNYYSWLYQLILLPTILSSSILTILNTGEINQDVIKIINITINGINTILLAINSTFKFNDRFNHFKTMRIKFNALNHKIESLINKNKIDITNTINIDDIINEFDLLYNDIQFQFPSHIKNKVIKKYGNSRKLPNSLQIEVETPTANSLTIDVVSFQ